MKKIKFFICFVFVLSLISASFFTGFAEQKQKMYGDVDGDGSISILDVTLIQKHISDIDSILPERIILGDVNEDGQINILDVTCIQKCIVSLDGIGKTGQIYQSEEDRIKALEKEVFELTNKQRVENGLEPLVYDKNLEACTDVRAKEISVKFDHTRPNGTPWYTVFSELGFSIRGSAGENIAAGYVNPSDVVEAWMNSPGHRANILSANFKRFAAGLAIVDGRYYWVQLFMG